MRLYYTQVYKYDTQCRHQVVQIPVRAMLSYQTPLLKMHMGSCSFQFSCSVQCTIICWNFCSKIIHCLLKSNFCLEKQKDNFCCNQQWPKHCWHRIYYLIILSPIPSLQMWVQTPTLVGLCMCFHYFPTKIWNGCYTCSLCA